MPNIQGILCLILIITKINKWWRITGKQGSRLLLFSTLGFMSSFCSLFFTSMLILLCTSNVNTSYNLTISKRRKCHISASATTAEKLPFPCWRDQTCLQSHYSSAVQPDDMIIFTCSLFVNFIDLLSWLQHFIFNHYFNLGILI